MATSPYLIARPVLMLLLGAAAFAAAYGQAPLYYSNQNQYFLHGLAAAGAGLLPEDWLANTRDPTPLFSALVAVTARYAHPGFFYLYHALLLGGYAASMVALFAAIVGPETASRRWPVFLALLIAVHSAAARWGSYTWLGQDFPWYFQAGVAGQYLLGAMLQPSLFGVLLLGAVALYVWNRPGLAVLAIALAATIHPTYLLPGALLTLGFLVACWQEGRRWRALGLGFLALALVMPVTIHALINFRPTTPETFATAQDILVNLRIPHHARPDLWFDAIAGLQLVWIALALVLVRRTRLFTVLAVPYGLMLLLTAVQMATGSQTLALLFPWRISALLVPIATTVILSRLVAIPALPLGKPVARAMALVAVLALAVGGVGISVERLAFRTGEEEIPLMEFVRRSRQPGDVYFLPVRVPDLAATTRGSSSNDFKPLPEKRDDLRSIPLDLQRFRLSTGMPIFVDFKAIPYQDVEVIEWRDRLRLAQGVQKQILEGRLAEALAELRRLGVTHLVQPAGRDLQGTGLEKIYGDSYYQVYRLP